MSDGIYNIGSENNKFKFYVICLFLPLCSLFLEIGSKACGMRSAERRIVNVLEMKCFRNTVAVSRMDGVGNKEVSIIAGIEGEQASAVDQRGLRWFGHVETMKE